MYDFYPIVHAYLIPLLSLSWPKRCLITFGILGSLIGGWYGLIFTRLYARHSYQMSLLASTQREYKNLSSLKNQIVSLEQVIAKDSSHSDALLAHHQFTATLLSLCTEHQLEVHEYGNQAASMPGTIKTHGCFKDQSTLLQKIHENSLPFLFSMCRMQRLDDDSIAMTLSFNQVR